MLGDNQDHHHMIFVFTFVPMKSVPIITKVNLISMVRCNLIQLYKVMFCHRFFPVSSTTDTMIQMKYCWHTINPIKHNPKLSSRSFSYQTGVCHQGHSLIKLESVIKVILLSNWSLSSRSFSYLSKLESVIKLILLSQQTGVCHQGHSLISASGHLIIEWG